MSLAEGITRSALQEMAPGKIKTNPARLFQQLVRKRTANTWQTRMMKRECIAGKSSLKKYSSFVRSDCGIASEIGRDVRNLLG
jgi:predicted metalloprotease